MELRQDKNGRWRVNGAYMATSAETQASQRARLKERGATAAELREYDKVATVILSGDAKPKPAGKAKAKASKQKRRSHKPRAPRVKRDRMWDGYE